MKENTIKQSIYNKINKLPYGSVFVVSDFLDFAENDTIKQNLKRFADEGLIQRVSFGIYYKPKFSKLLRENEAVDIHEVAKAIARNYNWSITPSGENALNMLGLSTQVPASYEYISSGPYREYVIDNMTLNFIHRNLKETQGFSPITSLVIQALKTFGKDNIDETHIKTIKSRLSKKDKETLLLESKKTTNWIYRIIKTICEEDNDV